MNKHRTLKKYKKIIIYFIEIEISNATILYNIYARNNNLKELDFHLFLLEIKKYDKSQNIISYNNPNLRKEKSGINILSKSQLNLDIFFIKENKNNQTNQIVQLCKLESFGKEKKESVMYVNN